MTDAQYFQEIQSVVPQPTSLVSLLQQHHCLDICLSSFSKWGNGYSFRDLLGALLKTNTGTDGFLFQGLPAVEVTVQAAEQ